MRNIKISKNTIIIVLIVIIIALIFINISNKNTNIEKKTAVIEQLTTETDNVYIKTQTHLSEMKEQEEKLLAFKSTIATAITNKGIETNVDDTAETMATNIAQLGNDMQCDEGEFTPTTLEDYVIELGYSPRYILIFTTYTTNNTSMIYSSMTTNDKFLYADFGKNVEKTETGFKYNAVQNSFVGHTVYWVAVK